MPAGGELSLCWQCHMLLQSSTMLLLPQGVCHRDLKLENTLLDGRPAPRLKICDFGYSKVRACLTWQAGRCSLSTKYCFCHCDHLAAGATSCCCCHWLQLPAVSCSWCCASSLSKRSLPFASPSSSWLGA